MYEYQARLIRVVDGDTVDLEVDLGFHLCARLRFRLEGINAPEMHGAESASGADARSFLVSRLTHTDSITVQSTKTGKFGRWLGRLFVDGADINQEMIESGHARPYDGGKRR